MLLVEIPDRLGDVTPPRHCGRLLGHRGKTDAPHEVRWFLGAPQARSFVLSRAQRIFRRAAPQVLLATLRVAHGCDHAQFGLTYGPQRERRQVLGE